MLLITCYKIQAYVFILQHKKRQTHQLFIEENLLSEEELAFGN